MIECESMKICKSSKILSHMPFPLKLKQKKYNN